jgi:hypothetical protein
MQNARRWCTTTKRLCFHKNLTYLQQTNNKFLTAKKEKEYDLCIVINWLFIILVLVSKEIAPQIAGHFFLNSNTS